MGALPAFSDTPETPVSAVRTGRRGAARLRLAIPARLISRYATSRCILIDLSATGAQVGMQDPLAKGETAVLEIAGLEAFGDVVRSAKGPHGGSIGITFETPISDRAVLNVRAFAETYQLNELRALRNEVKSWVEGS